MLEAVSQDPGWSGPFGPANLALLHYPLGLLLLAVLLEALARRRRAGNLRRAVGFILGLSAFVGWFGVGLSLFAGTGGELDPQALKLNRVFGVAVAAMSTLTWWLHGEIYPQSGRSRLTARNRLLLALALAGIFLTANRDHDGGQVIAAGSLAPSDSAFALTAR